MIYDIIKKTTKDKFLYGSYGTYEEARESIEEDVAKTLMDEGYTQEEIIQYVDFEETWGLNPYSAWVRKGGNSFTWEILIK